MEILLNTRIHFIILMTSVVLFKITEWLYFCVKGEGDFLFFCWFVFFGFPIMPLVSDIDLSQAHERCIQACSWRALCSSYGCVYELCPLCDINPSSSLPTLPSSTFPPAPILPSPCMMRPIWRCTTSASPLCPSWLTVFSNSIFPLRCSWKMLPSTGKLGYKSRCACYVLSFHQKSHINGD